MIRPHTDSTFQGLVGRIKRRQLFRLGFLVGTLLAVTEITALTTTQLRGLTPAEIRVLRLIAEGNANKEIGAQLSITEETVKGHVKNILSKLGANDRTHAVTLGLKRGIIEL